MNTSFISLSLTKLLALATLALATFGAQAQGLGDVLSAEHRDPANVARDQYRHPEATLNFFAVKPTDKVAEIWPGGGWYTEILAPYLRAQGQFYAVHFRTDSDVGYFTRSRAKFLEKLAANPAIYDKVKVTELVPEAPDRAGPVGQLDKVLTFRNVHNWMKAGYAEQAFKTFYRLLAPGGILGVVEHRAKPGTAMAQMIKSGYVTEAEVIRLAQQAGFVLDGKSDINANPQDTANHPKGVWTLPPTYALGDTDRARYQAIGESDRMTLRFKKPE